MGCVSFGRNVFAGLEAEALGATGADLAAETGLLSFAFPPATESLAARREVSGGGVFV